MKNKFYLSEFQFFDGESTIVFNIIEVNENSNTITVAVTRQGKISVVTYDLLMDNEGKLYFEYGCMCEKVHINNFEG